MSKVLGMAVALFGCAVLLATYSCSDGTAQKRVDINPEWQAKADSVLLATMERCYYRSGRIVVMEAETGTVKVMTSVDSCHVNRSDSLEKIFEVPYYTKLMTPFVYQTALQEDATLLDDTVDVGGGVLKVNGRLLRDHNWARGGYGKLTYKRAYASKSVVATYMLAKQVFDTKVDSLFQSLSADAQTQERMPEVRQTAWNMLERYRQFANAQTSIISELFAQHNWIDRRLSAECAELYGYSSTTRQDDYRSDSISSEERSFCVDFCGYFTKDSTTYLLYVMIEKGTYPSSSIHLRGIVPVLTDYIYNSAGNSDS